MLYYASATIFLKLNMSVTYPLLICIILLCYLSLENKQFHVCLDQNERNSRYRIKYYYVVALNVVK